MRLTLRTLLAYLDKVLEPNDAKALEEKIVSGRLARGMIDRIHSVLARPKLAAPKFDARGVSGDANVVAEYLDNTLAAQQVVGFEQACLGEDARLAEVASCHQILTIVLAKPASVTVSLKERIRRIGNEVLVPAGETNEALGNRLNDSPSNGESVIERGGKKFRIDSAHTATTPAQDELRQEPRHATATAGLELDDQLISHVPEYLRSGKSGEWTNAIMVVGLVAALLFVAWLSLGSFDEVRQLLYPNSSAVIAPSKEKVMENAPDRIQGIANDPPMIASSVSAAVPPVDAAASPGKPAIEESSSPPPIPSVERNRNPETSGKQKDNGQEPPNENQNDNPSTPETPVVPAISTMPPLADLETDAARECKIEWQPETKQSTLTPIFVSAVSKDGSMSVRRLAVGESASPNERVTVPPAFRTEFRVEPGIRWIVADETSLSTDVSSQSNTAAISLQLGRAMVHATPDCQRLLLKTPMQTLILHMKDTSSIMAIELRYKRVVGSDLEKLDAKPIENSFSFVQPILNLVCVSGEATVEIQNVEPIVLEVGQGVEWVNNAPIRSLAVREIPWWYRSSIQRPIDAEAAEELARLLSVESNTDSMIDRLQMAALSRRGETAALALRTLFMFGRYSHFFGSDGMLSTSAARPHRVVLIDSLYQSLGVDATHISKLKEAVQSADPLRFTRILGLLSLPGDSQLADGADRGLVESLSGPFLDERILGIYQLNAIVGKEYGFQSDRPNAESIQQWKRLLNSGKIRWQKNARE